ncbi:hypothetical protein ACFVRD_45755 [Streptomyces sp. NPDC057908]|uniref:hypothetical protein n=1 Tax=Streptomyces sp. NPDC057908 TaxID=3346276 RepID=UPI0036E6FC0F
MDAELAVTIERLQRMRTDIELILRQAVPTDRPSVLPGRGRRPRGVSPAERSLTVVMAQALGRLVLDGYADTLRTCAEAEVQRNADPWTPPRLAVAAPWRVGVLGGVSGFLRLVHGAGLRILGVPRPDGSGTRTAAAH